MAEIGTLYTTGLWTAKPGKAEEFAAAWRDFAEWTSKNQPGASEGYLLQDVEDENRFVSFGPWPSTEVIAQWRATPQFAEFAGKARALCDEIQTRTLTVAAFVS